MHMAAIILICVTPLKSKLPTLNLNTIPSNNCSFWSTKLWFLKFLGRNKKNVKLKFQKVQGVLNMGLVIWYKFHDSILSGCHFLEFFCGKNNFRQCSNQTGRPKLYEIEQKTFERLYKNDIFILFFEVPFSDKIHR